MCPGRDSGTFKQILQFPKGSRRHRRRIRDRPTDVLGQLIDERRRPSGGVDSASSRDITYSGHQNLIFLCFEWAKSVVVFAFYEIWDLMNEPLGSVSSHLLDKEGKDGP